MSDRERLDRDQVLISSFKLETVGDQIKLLGTTLETNGRVFFVQQRADLWNYLTKDTVSAKSLQER